VLTSPFLSRLNSHPLFRKAVDGILCSFVGLLLSTAVRLGLNVAWDLPRIALACIAFGALLMRVDLLWVVLGVIAFSLIFH
jgi:chromate transporter